MKSKSTPSLEPLYLVRNEKHQKIKMEKII